MDSSLAGREAAGAPGYARHRRAESAALLVEEVLPAQPMRQWVLSVPHAIRFLFAAHLGVMGKVLAIVYRTIETHLIHKAVSTIRQPPAIIARQNKSPAHCRGLSY